MPLTFIDIEKQKSWRIGVFFFFLLVIYFFVTALVTAPFLRISDLTTLRFWIVAGVVALVVAGIHFWISAYDTVNDVIRTLGAQPPDPQDDIHKMLLNIMQEIHIVTGKKRTMRCVVIPTLSLNALAVADLKGDAVIGITEGLLSRLTRPQLETVIAHEAHHIISGDCLETTVAASLFGTYSSAIEKLSQTSQGRTFLSPAFLLAWLLLQLSYVVNMFISREREYRADAASVRMTRNPTALAEVLYLLSRSWRGAGFIGSGLEMLCIVNPRISALDEAEGFWSDLLSTHPPLGKRIDCLLAMAHTNIAALSVRLEHKAGNGAPAVADARYYAQDPRQAWQGPFNLAELATQPWLSPLTWIMKGDDSPAERAWKDPQVNAVFAVSLSGSETRQANLVCPVCGQPLITASSEGAAILQCRFCSGVLVENDKIPRILARTGRDRPCTDRINALAKTTITSNQMRYTRRKLSSGSSNPAAFILCPKCRNAMYRGFYSQAYLVEIDRCSFCGLTWFDQNELEILQCLIANRMGADTSDSSAAISAF
jgi:Zn-dependent protease with chaperone function/Zn-finger nucleic acid-binding protein